MTKHLAIVGPTASNKSALAIALANLDGNCELVSLDSMQVYRGMDIGTAKPSATIRAAVPHHLIDVVDCSDSWTVARAQTEARAAVADIEARGKRAILVGGTGLYVQAVIDNLSLPGEDLAVRAALDESTSEPGGLQRAWQELCSADPVAASRIDEHNQRRIVRALEVTRSTGKPFSSFGAGMFHEAPALDVLMLGLWWPRDVLARRIATRFAAMRDDGLVEEVRALAPRISRTAAQAIGYKELLQAGRVGVGDADSRDATDSALDLAVRRTRSFARRQRMWFRRDPRIVWFECSDQNSSAVTAATLACWRASE